MNELYLEEAFILVSGLFVSWLVLNRRSRINIRDDFYFVVFFCFGLIYTVIAPAMVIFNEEEAYSLVVAKYPQIQLYCLVFFFLPLGLIYLYSKRRPTLFQSSSIGYQISGLKLVVFCVLLLLLELVFTVLAVDNDMYARRISTEKIAEVISQLDMATLTILRTHDLVTLPMIALLIIMLPSIKLQMAKWLYLMAQMTLIIVVLGYIVFAVVNSRTMLILLALAVLFAFLMRASDDFRPSGRFLMGISVSILYGLVLISNVRNHGADANVQDIINPVSFITQSEASAFSSWEWTQRLDCVDLIAQMDDSLKNNDYEWGRAWERPLVTLFGQIFGLNIATEYKNEAITTAKSYLIERHTDLNKKDYPSCIETDLWGNFGAYGLPMAGLCIAIGFVWLRYGLVESLSPAAFATSLVFAFYLVAFEKEFIDWMLGWIKLIPAIALMVVLNPIQSIIISKPNSPSERIP